MKQVLQKHYTYFRMAYFIGVVVGALIGWSVGYLGKKLGGGRGLINNPWTGAIVGIVVGLLYGAAVSA